MGQPWLDDDDGFYVRAPCPPGFEEMKVQELMIDGMGMWDIEPLNAMLLPDDFRRVVKMALPLVGVLDGVI